MARKIVIDNSNGEVRAAVIEDGKLADLFIERSRHPSVLGNIYKGRVENVLPGMQASFVDIGLEKNAFLYVDDATASLPEIVRATRNGDDVELPKSRSKSIKELLKPGQDVLVQVTKEAIGTKGARVVTDVTLAGRYVVLIPSVNYVGVSRKIVDDETRDRLRKLANKAKPRGMGLIVRTVAEEQPDEEIVRDIEFLTRAWKKIRARAARSKPPCLLHYDADLVYRMARDYFGDDVTEFTVNTTADYNKVSDLLHLDEMEKDPRIRLYSDKKPVFEAYGIEDEIWKATRRKVWLSSGGYLIFDTTEALTVVDVNTGKFTGSKDLEDTAFRNNIESAGEIARQLRLRNIGGIIIADFIDMESEDHRKRVLDELEKHLLKDKAKTSVLGITKLGLIEMTRKKSQQGLVELTHRVCDVCEGRGKVISEETLALRAERLIKREAATTDMQALLIGLNPYVAEELSQDGGAAIKQLEEQTLRDIFIRADASLAREDVKVLAAGSLEEILSLVHPVKKGDAVDVVIGQPDETRNEYGIGMYNGLPIHVEDAGDLVGKSVRAKIVRVFKSFAKARIEGRPHVYKPSVLAEEDFDEDGLESAVVGFEEPGTPIVAEGVPSQEAKRKRRRRRHRKPAKEGAAPTGEGQEEKQQTMPAVEEPASETQGKGAEGADIKVAGAVLVGEAIIDVAKVAKKRRRRRHRGKKPAGTEAAAQSDAAVKVDAQVDTAAQLTVGQAAKEHAQVPEASKTPVTHNVEKTGHAGAGTIGHLAGAMTVNEAPKPAPAGMTMARASDTKKEGPREDTSGHELKKAEPAAVPTKQPEPMVQRPHEGHKSDDAPRLETTKGPSPEKDGRPEVKVVPAGKSPEGAKEPATAKAAVKRTPAKAKKSTSTSEAKKSTAKAKEEKEQSLAKEKTTPAPRKKTSTTAKKADKAKVEAVPSGTPESASEPAEKPKKPSSRKRTVKKEAVKPQAIDMEVQ